MNFHNINDSYVYMQGHGDCIVFEFRSPTNPDECWRFALPTRTVYEKTTAAMASCEPFAVPDSIEWDAELAALVG